MCDDKAGNWHVWCPQFCFRLSSLILETWEETQEKGMSLAIETEEKIKKRKLNEAADKEMKPSKEKFSSETAAAPKLRRLNCRDF